MFQDGQKFRWLVSFCARDKDQQQVSDSMTLAFEPTAGILILL